MVPFPWSTVSWGLAGIEEFDFGHRKLGGGAEVKLANVVYKELGGKYSLLVGHMVSDITM